MVEGLGEIIFQNVYNQIRISQADSYYSLKKLKTTAKRFSLT